MQRSGFTHDLIRPSSGEGSSRVTYVELFFDLVFVFAVTQVSHILIDDQSDLALVHTIMLALVVWWAWVDTTWAASWLNPERGLVRGLFIALMALGLLMSSAIPDSFGDRAALFAISLVTLNLVRSLFTALAFAERQPGHAVNFVRISVWQASSGVLWIVGAFSPGTWQLWIWLAALVIDYLGPRARFWTPGLRSSPLNTWDVSGGHMSERVSLFVIIALGESIVDSGMGFSQRPLNPFSAWAFLAGFAGTVLMWFLYFNHAQRAASEYLIRARERGLIAQVAFTYIPALLILGVILAAVANGLVIAAGARWWAIGLLCTASAVYLLGNMFFKRASGGPLLFAHLIGAAVLVVLFGGCVLVAAAYGDDAVTPLVISWAVNAVLLLVVIADEMAFRRRSGSGATGHDGSGATGRDGSELG
ncbi:MAG TPA: low temperature requirement protein A [Nitrolancea sp.]|nr:low temperature requirement protein A [Nitrolancea sp.]